MKIRKLDTNGDIHFGYGDADFISDSAQTVAQKVVQRLRLWEGEWFLDVTAGTPWKARVLGRKYSRNIVQIIKQRIEETEGVQSVSSLDVSFDGNSRNLKINAHIMTEWGGAIVSVGNEPASDVPTPTPPPPPNDLRRGITHHWAFGDGGSWDGTSSVPEDTITISKGTYWSANISGIIGGCASNTNVNTSGTGVSASVPGIGTTDYSAAIWIKRASSSTQYANDVNIILSAATIGDRPAGGAWFGLGLSKNGTTYQVPAVGYGDTSLEFSVKGTQAVTNDEWHLLVVTINHDSAVVTLYCDGVVVGTGTAPAALLAGTRTTTKCGLGRAGTTAGCARSLIGSMDEFSIWYGRALSADEVSALWNNGEGLPFEDWT